MGRKKEFFVFFWGLTIAMGAYSQTRLALPNDPSAAPGPGQAEIIINAEDASTDVLIWLNGEVAAHIAPKTWEKIIVNNGRNTIEAADTTIKSGNWNIGSKRRIRVDSNSNRTTINLDFRYSSFIGMSNKGNTPLIPGLAPQVAAAQPAPITAAPDANPPPVTAFQPPTPPAVQPASPPPAQPAARPAIPTGGIEGAVGRAGGVLEQSLPGGATLAIISIASPDTDMAEFVIEELTYMMVSSRKFTVVDRKGLDAIMAERKFQYSGEVDDNSAVSIGKMLGASIVITGSISGSGSTRRLSAKALDVMTAKIEAMAREAF